MFDAIAVFSFGMCFENFKVPTMQDLQDDIKQQTNMRQNFFSSWQEGETLNFLNQSRIKGKSKPIRAQELKSHELVTHTRFCSSEFY